MSSKFSVFSVSPASPQFFGDIAIVVGASPDNGGRYKGESFVLIERGPRPLYHTRISVNAANVPSNVLSVDLDFVLDAALGAGKGDVAGLLNSRFEETKDWSLFAKPIEFQSVEPVHLARLWMMNRWQKEMRKIYDASECEALIEWLNTVKQCPTITVSHDTSAP